MRRTEQQKKKGKGKGKGKDCSRLFGYQCMAGKRGRKGEKGGLGGGRDGKKERGKERLSLEFLFLPVFTCTRMRYLPRSLSLLSLGGENVIDSYWCECF